MVEDRKLEYDRLEMELRKFQSILILEKWKFVLLDILECKTI